MVRKYLRPRPDAHDKARSTGLIFPAHPDDRIPATTPNSCVFICRERARVNIGWRFGRSWISDPDGLGGFLSVFAGLQHGLDYDPSDHDKRDDLVPAEPVDDLRLDPDEFYQEAIREIGDEKSVEEHPIRGFPVAKPEISEEDEHQEGNLVELSWMAEHSVSEVHSILTVRLHSVAASRHEASDPPYRDSDDDAGHERVSESCLDSERMFHHADRKHASDESSEDGAPREDRFRAA